MFNRAYKKSFKGLLYLYHKSRAYVHPFSLELKGVIRYYCDETRIPFVIQKSNFTKLYITRRIITKYFNSMNYEYI